MPIDGEIHFKLFGAVREAISIVIRQAALPQIGSQGRVEVFSTIKIANRCGNMDPSLK